MRQVYTGGQKSWPLSKMWCAHLQVVLCRFADVDGVILMANFICHEYNI